MNKAADIVLRVGVAFAFLYPPYAALGDPTGWLGYFPRFVLDFGASVGLSNLVMLHAFGVIEVVIALWLLSGKKIFYPAALAALMLAAIVIFDFRDFEVVFRDLSIAAAALALALMHWPKKQEI
jgi:uncharacterized membrane protein YphA (DoxX/SURF4 family)